MKSFKSYVKEGNPGANGIKAARQDALAATNKRQPFGYYADEFWALEEIRQKIIDLRFSYSDQNFQKAAVMIEKAQNMMLKSGR